MDKSERKKKKKSRLYPRRPRDDAGKVIPLGEWQRTRWTVLYCAELGKVKLMDTFQIRLSKMRKAVVAWADDVLKFMSLKPDQTRMVMVMLTYRRAVDYRSGHIRLYVKDLKRRLGKGLISFAWVSEIQERGALHYHLVLLVWRGTKIPLPDKSGMWKHGWSGIHTARTPFYLVKYAGKEAQKDLARYPKGARLYAVSPRLTRSRLWFENDHGDRVEVDQRPAWPEGVDPSAADRPVWQYIGSAVGDYEKAKSYVESAVAPEGSVIK